MTKFKHAFFKTKAKSKEDTIVHQYYDFKAEFKENLDLRASIHTKNHFPNCFKQTGVPSHYKTILTWITLVTEHELSDGFNKDILIIEQEQARPMHKNHIRLNTSILSAAFISVLEFSCKDKEKHPVPADALTSTLIEAAESFQVNIQSIPDYQYLKKCCDQWDLKIPDCINEAMPFNSAIKAA